MIAEASGVREGIFESIEGSMTSDDAKLPLLGNPTSLEGTFYNAFHKRVDCGRRSIFLHSITESCP